MPGARRTIQPKSCSKGHVYVGDECPCEHSNRPHGADQRQVPRGGSATQREPTRNLPKRVEASARCERNGRAESHIG
jgi:hypothetical protein